ncbi:hypothetical protein [Azoarcus sp. CIB]|uniref:hypothetical protein n=1 Tax=Aromatoleum sp. (strain CIB) TaxID=198107 RepID=UPI00067CD9CE|nr:hypothetical protein [Azoarcus sp. CIB]
MTEDQLEQKSLGWLGDAGYSVLHGPDIAPDGDAPERTDYQRILLVEHMRGAADRLAARVMQEAVMENPTIVVITYCNNLDG